MNNTSQDLKALFDRIPRRHSPENVKEFYAILDEYETLLQQIEAENTFYEQNVPEFFEAIDPVRVLVKKSSDNKASKKMKDTYFDEASGNLKDSIEALTVFYADGKRTG